MRSASSSVSASPPATVSQHAGAWSTRSLSSSRDCRRSLAYSPKPKMTSWRSRVFAKHLAQARSTNPLERFNPRLAGAPTSSASSPTSPRPWARLDAIDANGEWLVGCSDISQGSVATLYDYRSDDPFCSIRGGGRRARRRVSTTVFTDETSAEVLHHVPGLDCAEDTSFLTRHGTPTLLLERRSGLGAAFAATARPTRTDV
jgi:hypothetical protein